MNRDQADALARFLHLCRPEWDHPGILKALGDAKGADPLNAALAAIRWTANPDLRTPGGMGRAGDHWNERATPPTTPRPPKPSEACRHCGRHMHTPDAICDTPTLRPVPRTSDADALARLRVIHDETAAELCSHHVSRANCLECRRPTEGESDA